VLGPTQQLATDAAVGGILDVAAQRVLPAEASLAPADMENALDLVRDTVGGDRIVVTILQEDSGAGHLVRDVGFQMTLEVGQPSVALFEYTDWARKVRHLLVLVLVENGQHLFDRLSFLLVGFGIATHRLATFFAGRGNDAEICFNAAWSGVLGSAFTLLAFEGARRCGLRTIRLVIRVVHVRSVWRV